MSMSSLKMSSLPAMKRHHLLAEFCGLKQLCPEGVFVSLTPGDVSMWSGVIFVRKGPYEPAILRFQISFPDTYPSLPPLVTFSTDMFHPLITPLTTYMYTTDIQDNGTVSATDEERLPPGGFSLRHGFPGWFGRGSRGRQTSGTHQPSPDPAQTPQRPTSGAPAERATPASSATPPSAGSAGPGSANSSAPAFMQTGTRRGSQGASTYEFLRYIRSTFDNADVLDAIPIEAAGNPGAWHAWRTYRGQQGALPDAEEGSGGADTPRRPGEWNWDGVWEERSKRNIDASLSEPVLFGDAGMGDDVITFLSMENSELQTAKATLLARTPGTSA